jgi:hypothetical protein
MVIAGETNGFGGSQKTRGRSTEYFLKVKPKSNERICARNWLEPGIE